MVSLESQLHSLTYRLFSSIFAIQKFSAAGHAFDSGANLGILSWDMDRQLRLIFRSHSLLHSLGWKGNGKKRKMEIKYFLLIQISKFVPLRIEHVTAGPCLQGAYNIFERIRLKHMNL